MSVPFQPTADNVLVRLIAAPTVEWADVVAVGLGRATSDGTLVGPNLVAGDRIALRPHSAMCLRIGDQDFAVVAGSDVLGVLLQQTEAQGRPR